MNIKSKDFLEIEHTLVHMATFLPVQQGERVEKDGRTYAIVGGKAPRHEASSGRVWFEVDGHGGEYFPNVFDMAWIVYPYEQACITTAPAVR